MDLNLPQLAIGSHDRGSGYACVMNALSYLKGDKVITDYPTCVDPMLARAAQLLNDKICRHVIEKREAGETTQVLCSACAHRVWLFGAEIMGTGAHWHERYASVEEALAIAQWDAWSKVYFGAMANLKAFSGGAAKQLLRHAERLFRGREWNGHASDYIELVNIADANDLLGPKQATHLKSMAYDMLLLFNREQVERTRQQTMESVASAMVGSLYVMAGVGHMRIEMWARHLLRRWRDVTGFAGEPMILSPERAAQLHEAMAAAPVTTGLYETV